MIPSAWSFEKDQPYLLGDIMELNDSAGTTGSDNNIPKATMSPASSLNLPDPEMENFTPAATLERKEPETETQDSFNEAVVNPSVIDPKSIDDSLQSLSIADVDNSDGIESTICLGVLPLSVPFSDPDLDALTKGYIHDNNSNGDDGSANGSSRSTSPLPSPAHHSNHSSVNSDSTYEFEQEPFDTYRNKSTNSVLI